MIEHVPAAELESFEYQCVLCGYDGERNAGLELQTNPDVVLLECPRCHVQSASSFPSDQYLRKIYNPEHYSGHLVADSSIAGRCADRILELTRQSQTHPKSILDYGGGNGELSKQILQKLEKKGYSECKATIVELFPNSSTEQLRFVTVDEFLNTYQTYDLVIASAVLEHLKDAGKILRKLFKSVSEDGMFYARTPFEEPLARIVPNYKIKWPRHLHDMGPQFWNSIARIMNFEGEIVRSQTSIVESTYAHKFMRTLSAQILKAPSYLETAIRNPKTEKSVLWPWVGGWEVAFRKNLNSSMNA